MLTVIGSGISAYDFSKIKVNLNKFDIVICDKNFNVTSKNLLKLNYQDAKEYILKNYVDKNIAYIVSGSPFFYSAGIIIANQLPKNMVIILDNCSSKRYIIEKLILQESEIGTISLHGREKIDLEEFFRKKYTFVLCDVFSISKLKKALKFLPKESYSVTIGYKLGFKDEKIQKIDLYKVEDFDFKKPYVLLFEKHFLQNYGAKDCEFECERGMITKDFKRELTLSNLELAPNQTLWDIGAGSGSCGIVAFKKFKVRVVFFEKNFLRADMLKNNLSTHKVIDCDLYIEDACFAIKKVESIPDRIFLGGGGKNIIREIPYLVERLKPNGILLANIITLKHLNLALEILEKNSISYEIFSLSLTTYKGELNLAEPQRQLFQIKVKK